MGRREELAIEEHAAWEELSTMVRRLSPEQMELPEVTADGWSAKDLLWHIGCWSAEAARQLERIRMGTYEERDWDDTDDINRRYLEESRRLDLATVRAELTAARTRMLDEWSRLTDISADAVEWFEESGPVHVREHMEELRAYVEREAG